MRPEVAGDVRRVGETVGDAVVTRLGRAAARVHERRGLPADVLESDDAYVVVFDAPGAAAADVAVRCDGRTVAVRVERFREHRDGVTMRFPGRGQSLVGAVDLPEGASVDAPAATADLDRAGTLRVTLPKRPDSDPAAASDEAVDVGETDTPDGDDGPSPADDA